MLRLRARKGVSFAEASRPAQSVRSRRVAAVAKPTWQPSYSAPAFSWQANPNIPAQLHKPSSVFRGNWQRWYSTASPADQSPPPSSDPPKPDSAAASTSQTNATTAPELETVEDLSPQTVVNELDKHIVGQTDAKRAVAVAMRNRWRRRKVPKPLSDEIIPRNILMIGPTGVGKTEVARRVAKLTSSPFIKVEATKFTEVGFRGLDVDTIIKDLVEISITQTRKRERERLKPRVEKVVEDRILDLLLVANSAKETQPTPEGAAQSESFYRDSFREHYRMGSMDEMMVEYEAPVDRDSSNRQSLFGMPSHGQDFEDAPTAIPFSFVISQRPSKKKSQMKVKDVRPIMTDEEIDKLLPKDELIKKAIEAVENDGIVFFDEIDKICGSKSDWHPEASGEGVQRDLLPIIEGTTIHTRVGNVNTSKILFICSGAFHHCKPSDLLAELQGRLPIRVQLKGLTQGDLERILTEPENNIIRQETALLGADGVDARFSTEAVKEIAKFAHDLNQTIENIGARRLHTVVQRVTEDLSFNSQNYRGQVVVIDAEFVKKQLTDLTKQTDLKKFIW